MKTEQPPTKREWLIPDEDGEKVTDDFILSKIREAELNKDNEPYQLMIGTDSQLHGKQFKFVHSVCVYRVGRGGFYVYNITHLDRYQYKGKQQNRMFKEVEFSIDLANWILEETGVVAEIHIDASPKEAGHFTSSFSDQLKGYAAASGFIGRLKPESWAANCLSDRHTK